MLDIDDKMSLLKQDEAAKYLGTTVGTMNSWRCTGKVKIPYIKWGRAIRYRKDDLDAWIAQNTINKIGGENG